MQFQVSQSATSQVFAKVRMRQDITHDDSA